MSNAELYDDESLAVAVIGMAGRFPGADTLATFWSNLRDGVEAISFFSDQELLAMGVDPAALQQPHFVKASPVLDNIDRFDAAFFGYAPKEAEVMDPQQRLFLEYAWQALEDAGYEPSGYDGTIGVYAGTSLSSYLLFNVLANAEIASSEDTFPVMVANDKDFLSTRVSYHLNLKGPSIDIQTGCSTSLVAVHLACQSLLSYQCDMSLAGGVSVNVPQRAGYYYQEGGITSPDGHCRAFDANAQGTLFGSGVGVVVLKRLEDALADGDLIHAVIKGSAINNDGAMKVGYTAPSVDGQAEVIVRAQAIAGVSPDSISYVEAHGTGTPLGDPVEVAALTKAFRVETEQRGFCAIGSVKTNIGHLDAAAGIAGLIKTVLALKHRQLPPSLHFKEPNPRIDFANSPFYVNAQLADWPRADTPRRAGVSSFGIGGTNAHIILEEAPPLPGSDDSRPYHVLTLSAKTPTALDRYTANLAQHLKHQSPAALADVAYTLQCGRKSFDYRRIVIAHTCDQAAHRLEARDPQHSFTSVHLPPTPTTVFMFPGGGAQYVNMGRDLYRTEPIFRKHVDHCCDSLQSQLGLDLRTLLYPNDDQHNATVQRFKQTSLGLPALFVIEYALAQLWSAWGVKPDALIGHSLGEYTAACLAQVFSLEDALTLVTLRGRLFEELPSGSMLSVPLPEDELKTLLNDQLSLAAVNGAAQCVVAGTTSAVRELADLLLEQEIESRWLQIDVAAHSHLVEPILLKFRSFVEKLHLHPPTIPFISNVSGTWITHAEAVDPGYWTAHLRQTVRFGAGLRELLKESHRVLLEVGPGRTLSTIAKLEAKQSEQTTVLASTRHPHDRVTDDAFLQTTAGKLWLAGVPLDWAGLYRSERRRRLQLPTYPFEGQRFWIAPDAVQTERRAKPAGKHPNIDKWFYLPSWQRLPLPLQRPAPSTVSGCWLVFMDQLGLGARLSEQFQQAQQDVVQVVAGTHFTHEAGTYTIDPGQLNDYLALLHSLRAQGKHLSGIVHVWSFICNEDGRSDSACFEQIQQRGFYSLLLLTQALAEQAWNDPLQLWVVTNNAYEVESTDVVWPEQATIGAACKVIPQEYEHITCHMIDVAWLNLESPAGVRLVEQLMGEITTQAHETAVAYRGHHRWVQRFEALDLDRSAPLVRTLRQRGVYLITGGLGRIGLLITEHLARTVQAQIVLLGRTGLPDPQTWQTWLTTHDEHDPVSRAIRKVQSIEELGANVLVIQADVADAQQMHAAIERIYAEFGALHGVIHAAGLAGKKAFSVLSTLDRFECERHFRAKVHGVYVLEQVLRDRPIDFCMLFSSNAAILGGIGLAAYAGANTFMDAFVSSRAQTARISWLSVNWDGWQLPAGQEDTTLLRTSIDQFAMTPAESIEVLSRILSSIAAGQVVVSSGDLATRLAQWVNPARTSSADEGTAAHTTTRYTRPALGTEYIPPGTELEQTIVDVWQELLGIDQLGIYDNFFDLGGNSLIGLKVIARLKKELQIDIPVISLFEGPTVSALAGILRQAQADEPAYDQSQTRGGRRRERHSRKRQTVEPTLDD